MRSASASAGGCYGPYLRIDCGTLHLVEGVSDHLQVGDVSTVRIKGPVPRRTLREGVYEEFLNATRVDLEVKFVRDGVEPALKTEDTDQRCISKRYVGAGGVSY